MTLELNADAIQAMTPEQAKAALPTAIAALTLLVAKIQAPTHAAATIEQKRWLTVEEAAQRLHCGKGAIYAMVREHKLPRRPGKRMVFSPEEVDEAAEKMKA